MAVRIIDPEDSYVVRLMFGCGHGHVLPPGFSYWESGEACIYGHNPPTPGEEGFVAGPTDNASYHLYGRLIAVPIAESGGDDLWEKLCSHPDKFSHLAPAPAGAKEGDRLGKTVKLRPGAVLSDEVKSRYGLEQSDVIYYEPKDRS